MGLEAGVLSHAAHFRTKRRPGRRWLGRRRRRQPDVLFLPLRVHQSGYHGQ
jgi:hypothetical protein